jgi:predicted GNAT family acetyltransferase
MDIEVRDNPQRSRYELLVDSRLAGVAEYRPVGDVLVFPHTEIAPAMQGRGLGDELVRAALDDVRRTGRKVLPRCWFVSHFLREHPEYADLRAA